MQLKPRKASTDPRLRSLLQKATRRGVVDIVERVVVHLDLIGDKYWLRSRTVVIAYEECWPLSQFLHLDRSLECKLRMLNLIANSTKQKDAAGLGALAYAYRQGDSSTLSFAPNQRMLRIVSEALRRPKDFLRWAQKQAGDEQSAQIIRAAQLYLPAATWEWDKACILAGGLLAAIGIVPISTDTTKKIDAENFPYWVALDKHTDEGKVALREVAAKIGVSYRKLIWASFYCESAIVNKLEPSPWFAAECAWRLDRTGLTYEGAQELWSIASSHIQERLRPATAALRKLVKDIQPRGVGVGQKSFL